MFISPYGRTVARNLSSSRGGLIGNCEKQNVTVQFKSTWTESRDKQHLRDLSHNI
jgi:hypothetical protein